MRIIISKVAKMEKTSNTNRFKAAAQHKELFSGKEKLIFVAEIVRFSLTTQQ
jgi:hypothetical protein